MALLQRTDRFTRSHKLRRNARFMILLLLLFQIALPLWGAPPSEPAPPPAETERLERALDEALNALAEGMQTLVGLAEQSKEKWERCRSGASKEAWCLKMKDALARLERLGENGSSAPPESESESESAPSTPPDSAPNRPEGTR